MTPLENDDEQIADPQSRVSNKVRPTVATTAAMKCPFGGVLLSVVPKRLLLLCWTAAKS